MNDINYAPKYVVIQNYIKEKIKNGEFQPGEKIPSEHDLAERFNVSRITANSAIKELSTMGILNRIQGKGTFVCEERDKESGMVFGEKIKIPSLRLPDDNKHSILKIELHDIEANPELFKDFPNCTRLYEIVRIVENKEKESISSLDYSFFPAELVGDTPLNLEKLRDNYLHEYMRTCHNQKIKQIKLFLNLEMKDEYDIKMLKIDNPADILIWSTNMYDFKDKLMGYTITICKHVRAMPFIAFEL